MKTEKQKQFLIQAAALDLAMDYVLKDPAHNFGKLVDWVEHFDIKGEHASQIAAARPVAADPDNNWNQFIVKLCEEVDHEVRKATVRNFFVNASLSGMRKRAESQEKYGCNVPWAILMDPTSACNLHCTGCWAAEYSKGCLAGGRLYLHINANGDYEPCAFIHYADTNIRTHTLLEALQAPLFTAYKEGQPWNGNHLRPCPLLDNPQALVNAVERSGAHSTDLQDPENVRDLAAKCEGPAAAWAPVADEMWSCSHGCDACGGCGKEA